MPHFSTNTKIFALSLTDIFSKIYCIIATSCQQKPLLVLAANTPPFWFVKATACGEDLGVSDGYFSLAGKQKVSRSQPNKLLFFFLPGGVL